MQQEWADPIWRNIGFLCIVGFLALIATVLFARYWLQSRDEKRARIAADLLGYIGGSRVKREALSELSRRGRAQLHPSGFACRRWSACQ
jgi:hypothetical protein